MSAHRSRSAPEGSPERGASTPVWVARYARYAGYGLVAGTVLALAAFVTNPVPDPSFPWATLPASLRLPWTQPRIEHWPVSYTVGVWLWTLGFPALFLLGYWRFGSRVRRASTVWLVALPTTAMVGWTTYCRFLWPKLQPPTWNAPSYTFVCWLYCATYQTAWSNLAYAIALLGAVAALYAYRHGDRGVSLLAAFGVLAFPLGIPALYEAYRRHRAPSVGRSAGA